MGQILHGGATTTYAIRAAIQRSKAPLKELAAGYGLKRKTVAKWRKRSFLHDAPMGTEGASLDGDERRRGGGGGRLPQARAAAAGRLPVRAPGDDPAPHPLSPACFQRHGISRLPGTLGDKAAKKTFKRYPLGYFHIDIAESAQRRASCTSSWPWTGRRSTPSLDWSSEPQAWPPGRSWKSSSQPSPARSTPC